MCNNKEVRENKERPWLLGRKRRVAGIDGYLKVGKTIEKWGKLGKEWKNKMKKEESDKEREGSFAFVAIKLKEKTKTNNKK